MLKLLLNKYYDWQIKDLEDSLRKNPNDIMILNNLALYYDWKKDYSQAEEIIGRSLKINPSNSDTVRIAKLVDRNKMREINLKKRLEDEGFKKRNYIHKIIQRIMFYCFILLVILSSIFKGWFVLFACIFFILKIINAITWYKNRKYELREFR